jgi:redox-sensitive bicupin YhaK (pirin superfamily)
MEIVSYVLEGALEHRDSLGNGSVLRPGEFQRMSAGTGVTHSEFNPSQNEPVHFYQIWLLPRETGIEPSYEQRPFADEEKRGRFRLVASPDGADGSLTIQQDAKIYLATLADGQSIVHDLAPGRHAWLQVLRGNVTVNDAPLETSDGLSVSNEPRQAIAANGTSELMLFDLA